MLAVRAGQQPTASKRGAAVATLGMESMPGLTDSAMESLASGPPTNDSDGAPSLTVAGRLQPPATLDFGSLEHRARATAIFEFLCTAFPSAEMHEDIARQITDSSSLTLAFYDEELLVAAAICLPHAIVRSPLIQSQIHYIAAGQGQGRRMPGRAVVEHLLRKVLPGARITLSNGTVDGVRFWEDLGFEYVGGTANWLKQMVGQREEVLNAIDSLWARSSLPQAEKTKFCNLTPEAFSTGGQRRNTKAIKELKTIFLAVTVRAPANGTQAFASSLSAEHFFSLEGLKKQGPAPSPALLKGLESNAYNVHGFVVVERWLDQPIIKAWRDTVRKALGTRTSKANGQERQYGMEVDTIIAEGAPGCMDGFRWLAATCAPEGQAESLLALRQGASFQQGGAAKLMDGDWEDPHANVAQPGTFPPSLPPSLAPSLPRCLSL